MKSFVEFDVLLSTFEGKRKIERSFVFWTKFKTQNFCLFYQFIHYSSGNFLYSNSKRKGYFVQMEINTLSVLLTYLFSIELSLYPILPRFFSVEPLPRRSSSFSSVMENRSDKKKRKNFRTREKGNRPIIFQLRLEGRSWKVTRQFSSSPPFLIVPPLISTCACCIYYSPYFDTLMPLRKVPTGSRNKETAASCRERRATVR